LPIADSDKDVTGSPRRLAEADSSNEQQQGRATNGSCEVPHGFSSSSTRAERAGFAFFVGSRGSTDPTEMRSNVS
jgi:hypothetical protein